VLCRQRKYGEAAAVRRVAEDEERRERAAFDADRLTSFALRQKAAVAGQDAETAALAKRVGLRREEHVAQAAGDARRLAHRNANAASMLASRQAAEAARAGVAVRLALATTRARRAYGLHSSSGGGGGGALSAPASRGLLAAAPFRAAVGRPLLADGRLDTSVAAAAAAAGAGPPAVTTTGGAGGGGGGATRRASFTELVAAEVQSAAWLQSGVAGYGGASPSASTAAAAAAPLRLYRPTAPVVAGRRVPADELVRAHVGAGRGGR
jgi:hypothetical protein